MKPSTGSLSVKVTRIIFMSLELNESEESNKFFMYDGNNRNLSFYYKFLHVF